MAGVGTKRGRIGNPWFCAYYGKAYYMEWRAYSYFCKFRWKTAKTDPSLPLKREFRWGGVKPVRFGIGTEKKWE